MRCVRLLPSVGVFGLLLVASPLFAQDKKPVDPKPADPEPTKPEPKPEPKPDPRVVAQQNADKKALDAAGLVADDPAGLIKYLKARTLNPDQVAKITSLVQRMHADAAFDERVAAQEELLQIGGTAEDVLKKQAKDNPDAEIRYRVKDTLRRLKQEKGSGPEVTAAVVRALGRAKTDEAVAVLFGYLPLADPQLLDPIQEAVTAHAGTDGKPSQVLVDALADANPLRRQVAGVALASGGTVGQWVRFKEVHPKLVAVAKEDKEHGVRFAVAKALLLGAREKEAVGVLIDLMPDMTRGQSWQAEELLAQAAAGNDPPKERCKHARDPNNPARETPASKDARVKCRDAWKKWWEGAGGKIELDRKEVRLTLRGELVVVTQGWSNQQQVNVIEYAADDTEKARLSFPNQNGNLFDAGVRDDGSVVTLEQYNNQLTIRDATGKVTANLAVRDANANRFGFQAKGMELLENGGVIAVHQNGFTEFDKAGKVVLNYTRPEVNKGQPKNDLWGAIRLKNGETLLLVGTQGQAQGEMIALDAKGKEVADRKPVKVAHQLHHRNTLVQTGDDKVMLFDPNNARMQEYDLKTGKAEVLKWTNISSPMSIQRLPNGNLLTADSGYGRLVERSPDGTEVWSMNNRDPSGNTQFVRAIVR